jgi:hypothetical protein
MVTVADIQKDLPNWPAGVIEPWLIEFANDPGMGWPPEPYGDHRWGRLLGQRPLSWWQKVTWTLEKTDCGLDKLTSKAKADAMDIRKEMEGGKPSPTTKRRFDNIFRYVLNDGSFPVAPVAMRHREGLSPSMARTAWPYSARSASCRMRPTPRRSSPSRRTSRTSGSAGTRTASFRMRLEPVASDCRLVTLSSQSRLL